MAGLQRAYASGDDAKEYVCTTPMPSAKQSVIYGVNIPDNMLTLPNVGPPSSVTLAQRWQMTLAQRNFAHWPNVAANSWPDVGPMLYILFYNIGPTLGQCIFLFHNSGPILL